MAPSTTASNGVSTNVVRQSTENKELRKLRCAGPGRGLKQPEAVEGSKVDVVRRCIGDRVAELKSCGDASGCSAA